MNSPTTRTLKELRKAGYVCGITERYNSFIKIRQDLFNFIDLIALSEKEIIGVQCCAGSGHAAHKTKILGNTTPPIWLKAGGKIQIWSWSKIKVKYGGKAIRWTPRIEEIMMADFEFKDNCQKVLKEL